MKKETLLVIENHYLGAVLKGDQFDTFYHEHPRTYSLGSFLHISKTLGVNVSGVEFPSRYGGNIRVYLGRERVSESLLAEHLRQETQFTEDFKKLAERLEKWRHKKRASIDNLYRKHGKLPAKAFPGRAAILLTLLSLDESVISAVYEKPGSMKIGNYVPGTRIPIYSDEFLPLQDTSRPILNLAWHISTEIREYLSDIGFAGDVIDIVSSEDLE